MCKRSRVIQEKTVKKRDILNVYLCEINNVFILSHYSKDPAIKHEVLYRKSIRSSSMLMWYILLFASVFQRQNREPVSFSWKEWIKGDRCVVNLAVLVERLILYRHGSNCHPTFASCHCFLARDEGSAITYLILAIHYFVYRWE